MQVHAKDKVAMGPDGRIVPCHRLLVVNATTGEHLALAFAADTDEHWYEEHFLNEGGKIAMGPWVKDPNDPTGGKKTRGILYRRVVGTPFDIVDKETGEVLAESL